jgi:amidase
MESMAKSGSGDLSDEGAVLNPRNIEYLAGGSSSGSAAAVVTGDVDVAIGTDQGGSVRIPAAWCGCVGHKPTHGLVPYTGIVGIGHTFDHAGPLAKTVEDCAKVLEVIAGHDKYDPRQSEVHTQKYTKYLKKDPKNITVGRLLEGFGLEESEQAVDDRVETVINDFESAGAACTDVSVPLHQDGGLLWTAINFEAVAALVQSEGLGYFGEGYYDTTLLEAFATSRRVKADQFSPTLKMSLIAGQYMSDQYLGRYHAQAQNLRRKLREQYDAALQDVDVLALPTVPKTAHQYIENKSLEDALDRATDMASNTAPFDITGHPAVTVPCGTANGLPVGIMFVGEKYDDGKVLQAAKAFEANVQSDLPKIAEMS